MHIRTVKQLDQLNQDFYQQTAPEFAATRWSAWPGWKKFLPYITDLASTHGSTLTMLDVGCGGGRLARFLKSALPDHSINFIGVDSNPQLLDISQSLTPSTTTNWQSSYHQLNLINALLEATLESQLRSLSPQQPNVIFLIAVLHHIPSFTLRQQLVQTLAELLAPNGLLIFSTWQFLNSINLRNRIIDPATIGLDSADWEKNDFILDWRAGDIAYRYCHYHNAAEESDLIRPLAPHVIDDYFADGRTRNLNHYLIMQNPSSTDGVH